MTARRVPGHRRDRARRLHVRRTSADRVRRAGGRALRGPRRRRDLGADAVAAAPGAGRALRAGRGLARAPRRSSPAACGSARRRRPSSTSATRSCRPTRSLGGADADLIWQVFAARGMGYFASTRGDFDRTRTRTSRCRRPPASPTGTIRGVVRDDADKPVAGALVGLGGHDGPPAAGPALQAVTGADGSYTISGIPQAEYPQLTVEAPFGYADAYAGAVTRRRRAGREGPHRPAQLRGGPGAVRLRRPRRRRVAAAAAATSSTATRPTCWRRPRPTTQRPTNRVQPRTFQIDLGQQVPGAEVWIDPSNGCNGDRGLLARLLPGRGLPGRDDVHPGRDGMFDRTNNSRLNRVPVKDMPATVRTSA